MGPSSSEEEALSPKQSWLRGHGNQRSGRRCGGPRFAKVVEVDMYGFKVLRCAVKIKWDLVRAPLVVRARRCALRRCH